MKELPEELRVRIARMASNRESGATGLRDEAIEVLRAVRGTDALLPAARALCDAQPSMAPIRNAAIEAIASVDDAGRFERFAERTVRGSRLLARIAADHFSGPANDPFRCATLSASSAVRAAIDAVRARRPVEVWCSESRPALEGRAFAASLAEAGVLVTCLTDSGLGGALPHVEAVLVGADAVAPDRFLNKSGTHMLAAAAAHRGLPVYVLATRDKFVSAPVAATLRIRDADPAEVWDQAPGGVTVRNTYFEWTPLDVIASVITDAGVLGTGVIPQVCESIHDAAALDAHRRLIER